MTDLVALVPAEVAPDDGGVVAYDDTTELAAELLGRVGFFVPNYSGYRANTPLMQRMPRLEVVQLPRAGFEDAIPFLPDGVRLCRATGVHDASTAEIAVGLALAHLRQIDEAARLMQTGTWRHPLRSTSLADRTVLVVGAGGIGRAIQRRLEPFEAEVLLVGRTARAGVHGADELVDLVPRADIVMLAVPHDQTTDGLVDAAFLARMRAGALLVNVSRGPVVRTDDLVAALDAGHVHAALDVTDPEPLPSDHPLWRCPNVLIIGHVGGDTTAYPPRMRRLVVEQLQRWRSGDALLHVVAVGGAEARG